MPPTWVSRPVRAEGSAAPVNGTQGVWFSESSGALRGRLVELLGSAREVACISSFILADPLLREAILSASARGVRVYVLTATEQKLLKGPGREDDFSEKVLADHVRLLDDFALRTLLRSGEDLHAKYVLVDPRSTRGRGIIFTCNLATEGLTRNPEIALEVIGDDARDLFRMFLFGFWSQSKRELLEVGKITANQPFRPDHVDGPRQLPCTFAGSTRLRDEILRLAKGARTELRIASWKFAPDHASVTSLKEAARRGVRVRLLTSIRPSPEHMGALVDLVQAGVEARGLRYLHAKAVIGDLEGGLAGLVMSANFDAHGLDSGYEVGIEPTGARLAAVDAIWNWWWVTATHSLMVGKSLGELPSAPVSLYRNGGFEEVQIEDRAEMDLGSMTARTEADMASTRPAKFPTPETKGRRVYYKAIDYRWTVIPPSPKSSPDTSTRDKTG